MLDEQNQLATIRGLQAGSREAWTALYDAYSADVWRYACRLLGPDPGVVADVVQEAFLAVAETARQFDPARGTLWAWLAGIVHHRAHSYWRQRTRAERVLQLAESGAGEIRDWLDRAGPMEKPWERLELADLVRAVLAELPADYATLLTAKYLDDRSLAELSTEMGSTEEAIKSKLARARREFRAALARMDKPAPTQHS